MGKPIEQVAIVGGGTAGWLTASLLLTFGREFFRRHNASFKLA